MILNVSLLCPRVAEVVAPARFELATCGLGNRGLEPLTVFYGC